jgi:hypothetical protein
MDLVLKTPKSSCWMWRCDLEQKMFCIFADFLRNEERVKGEEEKKFSELKNANE